MSAPTPAPLFRRSPSATELDALHAGTTVAHLGIGFVQVGPDRLVARMPVDGRTKQPAGILHGGASVLLAETLGSCAASLCLPPGRHAVGLDVNANHIRAVREGWVVGDCRPVHIGRTTHVWQIEIREEASGRLVCTSRITMAILEG